MELVHTIIMSFESHPRDWPGMEGVFGLAAAELGVCKGTVKKRYDSAGSPFTPNSGKTKDDLIIFWSNSLTVKEINHKELLIRSSVEDGAEKKVLLLLVDYAKCILNLPSDLGENEFEEILSQISSFEAILERLMYQISPTRGEVYAKAFETFQKRFSEVIDMFTAEVTSGVIV